MNLVKRALWDWLKGHTEKRELSEKRDDWLGTELKGHCRVCLQIRYLRTEIFSQCSLNFGERPTAVLHFDIKTNPYKSALLKITRFQNSTKNA